MGINQRKNRKAQAAAKAALRHAGDAFTPKILKTKGSRRKLHRWSFLGSFTRMEPKDPQPAPDPGIAEPDIEMTAKQYQFTPQHVLVGNQADADKAVADMILEYQNEKIQDLKIQAIPHETISPVVHRQLKGYQDFNDILQTAYEQVVEDLVAGRPAISPDLQQAKQKYYEQAVAKLKQAQTPATTPEIQAPEPPQHEDKIDLAKLQDIALSPELV